ncbi:MAG: hypothetical protein ACO1O6_13370 [Bacteroidota bacterium]
MKKLSLFLLILFLLSSINQSAFGQKEKKEKAKEQKVEVEEQEKPKIVLSFENAVEQLPEVYDSTGKKTQHIILLSIHEPEDGIEEDVIFEVKIKHLTTQKEDISLINPLFKISKEDFSDSKSITKELLLYIYGDTTENIDETCELIIEPEDDKTAELDKGSCMVVILNQTRPEKIKLNKAQKALSDFQIIDSTNLGYFKLTDNAAKIAIYKSDDKNNRTETGLFANVKEVGIQTAEGRIEQVIIFCEKIDGHFKAELPISLTNIEESYHRRLIYNGSNKEFEKYFIEFGSVVQHVILAERPYFPPTDTYTLTPEDRIDTLRLHHTVNDYLDIRLYTDALGMTGKPNGIVQTEINLKLIGNTQNTKRSRWTWIPYVNMNLSFSKFDSKFDTLVIDSFSIAYKSKLLPIIQQSNIGFNLDFELLRYSRVHDLYLNLGHRILVTNVRERDTTTFARVFNPLFYIQPGGILHASPSFKCAFNLPFLFNYIHDQPFYGIKDKWVFVIQPEVELIYTPLKPNSPRYFARVRYYDMPNQRSENFFQIQVGANIGLSNVFNSDSTPKEGK